MCIGYFAGLKTVLHYRCLALLYLNKGMKRQILVFIQGISALVILQGKVLDLLLLFIGKYMAMFN